MGSWSLIGNNLGNPPHGFLGTTDNNALVVQTGNPSTERLRVDTRGNVGIGTASPGAVGALTPAGGYLTALDVKGPIRAQSGIISFETTNPTGDPTDNSALLYNKGGVGPTTSGFMFTVRTGSGAPTAERLRIDPSGNVGIGTTVPATRLHVSGSGDEEISISSTDAGGRRWSLQSSGNVVGNVGKFQIIDRSANASHLTIDTSGNVGIGTTAPAKPLDVAGSGGLRISQTAQASDANEIYFSDNGQIRSLDNNHRIIFNRSQNDLEIREFGTITFSPGATQGQRTGMVIIDGIGNLSVAGDVLLTGADCAEEFDAAGAAPLEPGTVVVIDEDGALRESRQAYDKKVAGVVSGAGQYRHGLVLDKRSSPEGRIPVALVGKVYCKVDARYSPIEVGDLLTTSPTPGHAMKAGDATSSFGAVIGKALKSLQGGQDLVPILVTLQ